MLRSLAHLALLIWVTSYVTTAGDDDADAATTYDATTINNASHRFTPRQHARLRVLWWLHELPSG